MKLVKHNIPDFHILNEVWTVHFCNHKPLNFTTRIDAEKYLRGEFSQEHGYMEYERVPSEVAHTEYYDIDYEGEIQKTNIIQECRDTFNKKKDLTANQAEKILEILNNEVE